MRGIYFSNKRRRLKNRFTFLKNKRTRKRNLNILAISAGAIAAAVALLCVILIPGNTNTVESAAASPPLIVSSSLTSKATPRPVQNMYDNNKKINTSEKQIGDIGVYREGIAFAAGTGSIDSPILKTLYYYSTLTQKADKIAISKVKYGEIAEVCIGENWIVWLDTDWHGNNILYKYERKTKKITEIQKCNNNVPKLRLHGDWLVWTEQAEKSLDRLHLVALDSGEDIVLYEFTDPQYAMSAPSLYNENLIFAGPDPGKPDDPNSSAIYTFDLSKNTNGELKPTTYVPGGYVHEPVGNGEAIAWIDTNKSPTAKLYLKYGKEAPRLIQQGVTSYSIGDEYLVYNYKMVIYAYFYKTDTLVRLSEPGMQSIQPVANENTVAWYETSSNAESDILKYCIME